MAGKKHIGKASITVVPELKTDKAQKQLDKLTKPKEVQIFPKINTQEVFGEIQKILDKPVKQLQDALDFRSLSEGMQAYIESLAKSADKSLTASLQATLDDFQDRFDKVSYQSSLGKTVQGLTAAFQEAEKLSEAQVAEVAKRISKNSSISGIKGMESLSEEAVNVTKVLSEMYDKGITDTERYITLQYKLKKIFDAMGKSYGGVRSSGAKNSQELFDFVIDGIQQRTGINLFSESGFAGVMDSLFGDADFSLFNKSLSKLKMQDISELLVSLDKTGDWVDMQAQVTAEVEKTTTAIEVQTKATEEQVTAIEKEAEATEKLAEARLELTPKKDGSGGYTAMDGKYDIGQDTDGWKVFQRDNAGLWNLIGTYKQLEDVRKDASLLTREEIVYTDAVIQEIKTLQEAYSSLDYKIKGHATVVDKYLELIREVKSGAMSAADAVKQLNVTVGDTGLAAPVNKVLPEQEYISPMQARLKTHADFVQANGDLIYQHQSVEPFKVKYEEIYKGILDGTIGLEEANKQLREFVDTLADASKAQGKLSKMILGGSGETLAGTQPISFKYAVMSVEDLVMSHDAYGSVNANYPAELQPRDRSRIASKAQILNMVKNLVPELLAASPTAQNGSPIVSNGGVVIGGNARSAALTEAYKSGLADSYKSYITEHASEFGLNANNMPKHPVLVRVVDVEGGLDVLAKQLNESTTAGYSTTEQALINEELVMKVISKLNLDESANLNSAANKDFVQSFIGLLSESQKGEMVTKDGDLSAIGLVKVQHALVGAAYGSREMLENLEQISPEFKNISNVLTSGAAKAADIRYSIENGILKDLGVVATLLNGVDLLKTSRRNEQDIDGYLNQLSLFGSDYSAEDIAIGKFLEANVRNATQLKNMVDIILDFAQSAGDPNQLSLDGIKDISLTDVVKGAFTKYAEQYKKQLNYDKLVGDYLPAEIGSRSDKRVDRTDVIEAEKKAIQESVQLEQEHANVANDTTQNVEAQVEAEKKLGEAAENTANKRKQSYDSVKNFANTLSDLINNDGDVSTKIEQLFEPDVKRMISNIRSAAEQGNVEWLKGIVDSEQLVDVLSNAFRSAYDSIGDYKFNGKYPFELTNNSTTAKIHLISKDESKTLDYALRLKNGLLEIYDAKQKIGTTSFNVEQEVEAANAKVDDFMSKLKGRKLDGTTELRNLANNIVDSDSLKAFDDRLDIMKKKLSALSGNTVSGKGMNPLANSVNEMENASITIETYRKALNRLGDVDGVAQATEQLENMASAAEEFKNASGQIDEENAFAKFSKAESKYKAYYKYAQESKREAEAESKQVNVEEQKIQQYYQEILNTVNKINELDKEIEQAKGKNKTGAFSEFINKTQEEKSQLIKNVSSTLSEVAGLFGDGVLGRSVSMGGASFFSVEDTNNLNAFLQSAQVQTALAQGDINTLNECLGKLSSAFANSDKISAQATANMESSLQRVAEIGQRIFKFDDFGNVIGSNGLNENNQMYNKALQHYQMLQLAQNKLDSKSPTDWTAEEVLVVQKLSEEFVKLGTHIDAAKQKEDMFFANKPTYTYGSENLGKINVDDIQKLGTAGESTKAKLEAMAQSIAKNSEGAVALTKNFTMGADGIAKLDFSILDTNTGSIKDFTIALGTATNQVAVFETTTDKALAKRKAAEKQLGSAQDLLGKLGVSGVDTSADGAPTQVQEVLRLSQSLSGAIKEGDQNNIIKLTQQLKMAIGEAEKLYKQMLQVNDAISSDKITNLGQGDVKGDIYGQLTKATQELAAANGATAVQFGKFDATTNTLDASLIHANGTVENFKVSMNGLNGQIAAQQAGTSKLTSSWDRFKNTIGSAGKQLMTALVGYNVFYKAIAEVRKGIGYVKEIDLALTELKKVTDETEESYRKFLDTAAGTAGEIGSTVSEFTEATANFARLGYTMEESADMAKTALVYKNVADGLDTVGEATDSIISTMKAFGIESNDTMGIVDRFNEVGKDIAQAT